MTAIAALVHDGKVYMAGDSAGVSGFTLRQRGDAKVFVNGAMVMGFTTSFRMGQLLRWRFVAPHHPDGVDPERYMSTDFVDAVRGCLKSGGFAKRENEVEQGGNFLVGYRGQIWSVDSDYQVGTSRFPFDAVGCGDDLCMGSLYSTAEFELDPVVRLGMSLDAAEAFSSGVRSPFVFAREP